MRQAATSIRIAALTSMRCFRNAYWAQLSRDLPRAIVPTDTGHRFLAVTEYPTSVGLTAE